MTDESTRRFSEIYDEIRNLHVAAITGQITHSVARDEIEKLKAELVRLWEEEMILCR